MKKILLFLIFFQANHFRLQAQAGLNDPTFNIEDISEDGFDNTVYCTAIQSDGKSLMGGSFSLFGAMSRNGIARLNINGSLDNTFNPGSGFDSEVYFLAVQDDGKIIVGGSFTSFNGIDCNYIARLNSNGTLDNTFNIGTGFDNSVETIVLQGDGKIIVGGWFTSFNGIDCNYIARLNSNGTLDNTFNIGTGFDSSVEAIIIQSNGKIIVGGAFTTFDNSTRNYIARLNIDGTLDNTFDPGSGFDSEVRTFALQSDNKILVGGTFTSFNNITLGHIARLNINGTLDNTFNTGAGFQESFVQTLALQNDGKIIVGGFFTSFDNSPCAGLVRLNNNGTLDNTFITFEIFLPFIYTIIIQNDGKVIIGGGLSSGIQHNAVERINSNGLQDYSFFTFLPNAQGFNSDVNTIAVQNNGKIIVGGWFYFFNNINCVKIARLNNNGTFDNTFNAGNLFGLAVSAIVIQGDGKIIVGGWHRSYDGLGCSIARLNNDGTLDNTFNVGTGFTDPLNSNASYVGTLALQNDGKIIVAGYFTKFNGTACNSIVRLNSDGTLDNTFNFPTEINEVLALALQNDGKVIAGGYFGFPLNGTWLQGIMRLNSNGTLDNTFNPGTGVDNTVEAIALQNDGKVIIGGEFESFNGEDRNGIARLNSDGSLDNSFDPGSGFTGSTISNVRGLILQDDDKLIVGGNFTSFNGLERNSIARLNSNGTLDFSFDPGTGFNSNSVFGTCTALALHGNDKVIAGGLFTSYNNVVRHRIARIFLGNTPIINSITFTNVIQNIPSFSQPLTLYSGSAYAGSNPIKICCDGSTSTYIKLNVSDISNISFRLLDENGLEQSDIGRYGKFGVSYPIGTNEIEIPFTHPNFLDINQLFRTCTLQVLYNGTPLSGINFPIRFYRAPVLMVHGLWGDRTTFKNFEMDLIGQNLYPGTIFRIRGIPQYVNENTNSLTYRIDYKNTNDRPFSENQTVIINGRNTLFEKARSDSFSLGKMIVVAHSMGGILSRLYLQSNHYRNEIQKLITLNSPHYGSQMANYLLWPDNHSGWPNNHHLATLLGALGRNPFRGAVSDLRVNSPAIRDLNISQSQQNKVPSSTISTKRYFALPYYSFNLCRDIYTITLNGFTIHNIFSSAENDMIVPVSSQRSGINLTSTVDDQCHLSSADNNEVQNEVIELINSNPNDNNKFTLNGFIPDSLPEPQPSPIFINSVTRSITILDSVKFISPTNNQIFNPGDSVLVILQGFGNVSKILFGAGNETIPSDLYDSATSYLIYKYKIPINAIGLINFIGLGGDSSGYSCLDSLKINVSSNISIDSIICEPNAIALASGELISLKVFGYYSDSVLRDISNEPSLQFATDTSIIHIEGNCKFVGNNPGETIIGISYNNKIATVSAHVRNDSSYNGLSIGASLISTCDGNTIQFYNQSGDNASSVLWTFDGGIPSSSTSQTPIVTYNSAGNYNVKLCAFYPEKIDSIILNNYITVNLCPLTLDLKVFIEGFYIGNNEMQALLFNNNLSDDFSFCDSIRVELHNSTFPYELMYADKSIITTTGNGTFSFASVVPGLYYLAIKHRNSIETWSKDPILFNLPTVYVDFTR